MYNRSTVLEFTNTCISQELYRISNWSTRVMRWQCHLDFLTILVAQFPNLPTSAAWRSWSRCKWRHDFLSSRWRNFHKSLRELRTKFDEIAIVREDTNTVWLTRNVEVRLSYWKSLSAQNGARNLVPARNIQASSCRSGFFIGKMEKDGKV